MKKTKKLKINELKIESFITSDNNELKRIQGGLKIPTANITTILTITRPLNS